MPIQIRRIYDEPKRTDGYRVLMAHDGAEGLRVALARRPDLVLLDLMLPERDSIDVCRALRDSDSMREAGIIMLTARDEESDVVLGLEMGAERVGGQ